ncbi:carotenoid oxygenase family protein [Haloarcula marina]|uniref:carotenoid oxygenase family protein n=1 Tax=Haloarcula marina TaxID=2961574 RepID=UPI0020B8B599|nr:carotenoid oxygenase family protein [Halomicroarcula marina]
MAEHPGFHSLNEETSASLSVDGTLPPWLTGSLVRNGPGAFSFPEGSAVDHWFDGLAMVTRFTFDPRRERVHYRNRFLRTEAYEAARSGEFDGGFATGETTLRSRLATFLSRPYDNTNIVVERVGDRFLALTESPRWVELDPVTLATTGHVQYDDDAPTGHLTCAHLKRDPATGTLVNVATEFGRPSRYHVYAMDGPEERTHVGSVPTEKPAYMHSFALTPRYVVLTEFPLRLDPRRLLRPGRQPPFIEQFEWEPERGTRIVVVDRTTGRTLATPTVDPMFCFHHVNAFERAGGSEVVFDLETVPDATSIDSLYLDRLRDGDFGTLAAKLERVTVTLDPAASDGVASTDRRTLADDGIALPTVSPDRWCRSHRYVYAMAMDQPVTEWARGVRKVDVESGDVITHRDGADYFGEPIFVPDPDGDGEDDGVVVTVGLDADASRLLVLDGATLETRARIDLPHRLPFDFHGRYFPEVRATG